MTVCLRESEFQEWIKLFYGRWPPISIHWLYLGAFVLPNFKLALPPEMWILRLLTVKNEVDDKKIMEGEYHQKDLRIEVLWAGGYLWALLTV